jgi:hypothetical protein
MPGLVGPLLQAAQGTLKLRFLIKQIFSIDESKPVTSAALPPFFAAKQQTFTNLIQAEAAGLTLSAFLHHLLNPKSVEPN